MNAISRQDAARDAATRPLESFDVSDPALYQNESWGPYFARLRREDPVHWCRESRFGPYWSISRYRDIMTVEADHDTFSNALGGIMLLDTPEDLKRPSFIRMDPPQHGPQRATVQPIASRDNLARMGGLIRERTRQVLDGLPRGVEFDWVERVSVELTTLMLATMLDFPLEERRRLTFWSDVAIADVTAPDSPVRSEEERFEELRRMAERMGALFAERQRQPPSFDLLSMLAYSPATREMPFREFMGNLALLIVGGNDTTRNTMTGGLLALSRHPGEWAKLRANPGLVAGMVPEMVRWVTPVIHMRRTARRDTELHGRKIRAGDKVVVWYVSGNRDEGGIEEPERFVIDRQRPRRHLAFGFGIHRCVGERLAELQLRILWEEILARFPAVEVLGPPQRLYSNFIQGIRSLPVRIPA